MYSYVLNNIQRFILGDNQESIFFVKLLFLRWGVLNASLYGVGNKYSCRNVM